MVKVITMALLTAVCFGQKNGKKLVWEEEFNGSALNEKSWNFEFGDHGWGNNERQNYGKDSHTVADGKLTITVTRNGKKYASTRITTKGKHEFKYGYMEARAKLPVGHGIWPAFWMLGANIGEVGWPKSGEIDIMEYIGREPNTVYNTLHTPANNGGNALSTKAVVDDIEEGFHTFGCDWSKDKIDFYYDGRLVNSIKRPEIANADNWPFDAPEFFILNVAVGGNFGGPDVDDSIFPVDYVVDYVKVWQ